MIEITIVNSILEYADIAYIRKIKYAIPAYFICVFLIFMLL